MAAHHHRPLPARTHWLRDESGVSLVEVLIAVMLIAVVSGGVGMAVAGASRQSVSSNGAQAQLSAANQVFERVRANRDWMQSCGEAFRRTGDSTACNLRTISGGLTTTVEASLMQAKWLGDSCAGGPFSFQLQSAQAFPRDSSDDGIGAADEDGVTPDFYRIQVVVGIGQVCDQKRLGVSAPAIVDSAVDHNGRVPTASLTVDVCQITNQVDERMNFGGCGGGTDPRMQGCATLPTDIFFAGNPGQGCPAAWRYGTWGDGRYRNPRTDDPSTYVDMRPHNMAFTLTGPDGSISSSSADRRPGTGVYVFNNLPVGTYTIHDLGLEANERLWWTKAIPSAKPAAGGGDPTSLTLSLQADTFNRALIPVRPNNPGAIDLVFKRRVRFYTYSGIHHTGWKSAGDHIPTKTFEGDIGVIYQWFTNLAFAVHHTGEGMTFHPGEVTISGNCASFSSYMSVDARNSPTGIAMDYPPTTDKVCSYYKLRVDYDYYQSDGLDHTSTFNGAVQDAAYSLTPAPTFRDQTTTAPAPGSCVRAPNTSASLVQLVNYACVNAPPKNATRGPVQRARISGISAGLNTGIKTWSLGTTWLSAGDEYGQTWTASDNGGIRDIPSAFSNATGGIWVKRDGSIMAGTRNYGTDPTITLIGNGECYWSGPGTTNHIGSCDTCSPYIAPLGGYFNACYVLVSGRYEKDVFFEGDLDYAFTDPAPVRADARTGKQVCDSVPAPGTYVRSAPNCHKIVTVVNADPGQGIPEDTHHTPLGPVKSWATPVGGG